MVQSVVKPHGSNTSFGKMTTTAPRRRSTWARMRSMPHTGKLLSTEGEACGLEEVSAFVAIARRRTVVKMSFMFSMLMRVVSTNDSGAAFQKMFHAVTVTAMMTMW
jgi:hypothetical protein